MKVILREEVRKLGMPGDIKNVADGFARNYLIPRKLAMPATPSATAWFEKGKEKRQKLREKEAEAFRAQAAKLEGTSLSFSRQVSEGGKLYGSVGKTDIVKSLKASGHDVPGSAVMLESSIKEVGEHTVEIRFHADVTAKIKVSVVARS